jgi:hypothetical protein
MRVTRFERRQDDGIQMSFEHFGRHLATLTLALLGVNLYLVCRGIVTQGK